MRPLDSVLILAIGLIWGANFVVTKLALSGWGEFGGAPPLFFAALRFGVVAVLLVWMLRPIPQDLGRVSVVALCFGALHFALLYLGIQNTTPSAAAVAIQLVAPFTTVLSVLVLGERVDWRRGGGVAIAFLGVALVAYDPQDFAVSSGVMLVASAAAAAAVGSVLIKGLKPLGPVRMQAWTGVISLPPLLVLSMTLEQGQMAAVQEGGLGFWAAVFYVVVLASIVGHGGYYYLLRRYDASLVAPQILTAPLWGMVFGVLLLGDEVTWRLIVGGSLALAGVMLIVIHNPMGLARWLRRLAMRPSGPQ